MTYVDGELQQKLLTLLQNTKVLSLATLNGQGLPEASLTPYLYYQDKFWIYVSRLSPHTLNMLKQPVASLLVTADQTQCPNPFTIERVTIDCQILEENDNQQQILDLMAERFGETIDLLRQLPDFYLFALKPLSGRFIKGFGQAYTVDFANFNLSHISPAKET